MPRASSGRYDPAYSIIERCGGARAVAALTERSTSRVYRWTQSRERGGTGGTIPYDEARKLLNWAFNEGIDLAASDFFAEPTRRPD